MEEEEEEEEEEEVLVLVSLRSVSGSFTCVGHNSLPIANMSISYPISSNRVGTQSLLILVMY